MFPMRHLLIPVLCTAFLVSCNEPAPVEVPETDGATLVTWPVIQETEGGSFSITLGPVGGEILNNTHFSLELAVKPAKADAGPIKVAVDADMPAHRHGMHTKPEVTGEGENRYKVDGMLFHMKGEWVIMVDVTGEEVTERATFPVLIE